MAQDPFEHVMDTNHLAIFETQNLIVHLPRFYIPGTGIFNLLDSWYSRCSPPP
jgi:hypothetical protein